MIPLGCWRTGVKAVDEKHARQKCRRCGSKFGAHGAVHPHDRGLDMNGPECVGFDPEPAGCAAAVAKHEGKT
jgi:hypothetical protein